MIIITLGLLIAVLAIPLFVRFTMQSLRTDAGHQLLLYWVSLSVVWFEFYKWVKTGTASNCMT